MQMQSALVPTEGRASEDRSNEDDDNPDVRAALDAARAALAANPLTEPPVYRGSDCVKCFVGARERCMPGCEHVMLCGSCGDAMTRMLSGRPTAVKARIAARLSEMWCIECPGVVE